MDSIVFEQNDMPIDTLVLQHLTFVRRALAGSNVGFNLHITGGMSYQRYNGLLMLIQLNQAYSIGISKIYSIGNGFPRLFKLLH